MDHRLIFIISQPRSGSTLLQHMLGSHSEVHTLPEPWFMLHAAYGLRPSGLEAEYNARMAFEASQGFLERIPGREATYVEAIRRMALYIYDTALEPSGRRYFLDKTPRYYLIIPDLYRIFPRAKFIILIRNPLAVLSSILDDSLAGNWRWLFTPDRRHDILTAPKLILDGIGLLGDQAAVVHYEKLVTEPEQTLRDICHRIGLEFESDMLEYGDKVRFESTRFMDRRSIYRHDGPVRTYLDGWLSRFDSPQKIEIAKGYLTALGEHTVNSLGYSHDDLITDLNSLASRGRGIIIPWGLLVTPQRELPWWAWLRLTLLTSLHKRGFVGTLRRYARFVLRGS